ncbi:MAG: hypothetical protein H6R01_1767 [Burkholderiaceae bacterium]|nr:hypothetical protein [Burkholderiaceae bacterium]
MFTLFSFADMLPMAEFMVGAIPAVTFAGMCGFAFFCLFTEAQREQGSTQNYCQPAQGFQFANVGQCN